MRCRPGRRSERLARFTERDHRGPQHQPAWQHPSPSSATWTPRPRPAPPPWRASATGNPHSREAARCCSAPCWRAGGATRRRCGPSRPSSPPGPGTWPGRPASSPTRGRVRPRCSTAGRRPGSPASASPWKTGSRATMPRHARHGRPRAPGGVRGHRRRQDGAGRGRPGPRRRHPHLGVGGVAAGAKPGRARRPRRGRRGRARARARSPARAPGCWRRGRPRACSADRLDAGDARSRRRARDLLAAAVDAMPEGHDTPDLRDDRASWPRPQTCPKRHPERSRNAPPAIVAAHERRRPR